MHLYVNIYFSCGTVRGSDVAR